MEPLCELEEITNHYDSCAPITGLTHKFIVPGWIGFIQQCMIESKMNKVADTNTYKGMTYYSVGDHIVDMTAKAVESHKTKYGDEGNKSEAQTNDAVKIAASAFSAVDSYLAFCPEIAFWMNRQIDDTHVTCVAGIMQKALYQILNPILPKEYAAPTTKFHKRNAWHDLKDGGYRILGMIINAIVLFAIIGLFSAIFD